MTAFKDITGHQRFGYLTVLHLIDPADTSKWLCLCDYGRQHIALGQNIKRGQTERFYNPAQHQRV
jgi:hypothetical protein